MKLHSFGVEKVVRRERKARDGPVAGRLHSSPFRPGGLLQPVPPRGSPKRSVADCAERRLHYPLAV